MSKILRAVILGAPASGKGTISKRIVDKFGFIHISPGDILRLNIQNNTKLGKKAKNYIDKGLLVPDDLVINCVLQRLHDINHNKSSSSWLLDGYPRTKFQAENLQLNYPIDTVIKLNVPNNIIIERAKNRWIHLPSGRIYNIGFNEPKIPYKDDITGDDLIQRPDDQPDTVCKRLEIYETQTKPVIDYYKELNIVYEFTGNQTNDIWPKIEEFLKNKMKIAMANCQ